MLDITQALMEAIQSRSVEQVAVILANDFQAYGTQLYTRQQFLDTLSIYANAFPDFTWEWFNPRVEGDGVMVYTQLSGTHTGTLDLTPLGIKIVIPPTGTAFTLPLEPWEISFSGKLVSEIEEHIVEGGGMRGILKQLGIEQS